jgi:hypothetical protein
MMILMGDIVDPITAAAERAAQYDHATLPLPLPPPPPPSPPLSAFRALRLRVLLCCVLTSPLT